MEAETFLTGDGKHIEYAAIDDSNGLIREYCVEYIKNNSSIEIDDEIAIYLINVIEQHNTGTGFYTIGKDIYLIVVFPDKSFIVVGQCQADIEKSYLITTMFSDFSTLCSYNIKSVDKLVENKMEVM